MKKINVNKQNHNDLIEIVAPKVETQLKIKIPKIALYDLIYEHNNQVVVQIHAKLEEIPPDANFNGGVYFDTGDNSLGQPVIVLARKKIDITSGNEEVVSVSHFDFLFNLIHEMRHIWQKIYHRNMYYNAPNAIGFEVITDIAEVDADSFAITWICENLKISNNDLLNNFSEFWLQSSLDGGARIDRVAKIAKKSTIKKINEAREIRKKSNLEFMEKFLGK